MEQTYRWVYVKELAHAIRGPGLSKIYRAEPHSNPTPTDCTLPPTQCSKPLLNAQASYPGTEDSQPRRAVWKAAPHFPTLQAPALLAVSRWDPLFPPTLSRDDQLLPSLQDPTFTDAP